MGVWGMARLHLRRRHRRDGMPRTRVTYANVTATLALVIALGGGTAWAAALSTLGSEAVA